MANLYYELSDSTVQQYGWKYLVAHDYKMGHGTFRHYQLMMMSDRIWLEEGDNIKFIKNRFIPIDEAINKPELKEFMLVKLKAHTY